MPLLGKINCCQNDGEGGFDIRYNADGTDQNIAILIKSSNDLECVIAGQSGGISHIGNKGWKHVVFTVTRSSSCTVNDIKLYIDGVQDTMSVDTSSGNTDVDINNTREFTIGTFYDTGAITDFFQGAIDDVRVYNRILTTDEIKRLYNLGR